MPPKMMRRTPLGLTNDDLSALVVAAAALTEGDDDAATTAFPSLPQPSPATLATTAPAMVVMLRILYGAVRDARMVERRPVVFAIGPLPVALDSADVEVRVDICDVPEETHAYDFANLLADTFPAVLAVAFEKITGTGALVCGGVPGPHRVVAGTVAFAHMAGDEDVPEGLHESWILVDGAAAFDPCVPVPLTYTPAEA